MYLVCMQLILALPLCGVISFQPIQDNHSLHVLIPPAHEEPLSWPPYLICFSPWGWSYFYHSLPVGLLLTFCLLEDSLWWKSLNLFYFPNLCGLTFVTPALESLPDPCSLIPLG